MSKQDLIDYVAQFRTSRNGAYFIDEETNFLLNTENIAAMAFFLSRSEKSEDQEAIVTLRLRFGTGTSDYTKIPMSNADLVQFVLDVQLYIQQSFTAEADVVNQINNETITIVDDIDVAWPIALAAAVSTPADLHVVTLDDFPAGENNAVFTSEMADTLSSLGTEVDGLTDDLANKPDVFLGTTQKTGVKMVAVSATVSGANAVFQLTDDGLSTGNALFTNVYLDALMLRAQEGANPHAFGTPALTNSNKTLTVPVSKLASLLGILTLSQSASGSVIAANVFGDNN